MKIGAPREVFPGEARVAMTPDSALRCRSWAIPALSRRGPGLRRASRMRLMPLPGVSIVPDAAALYAATDVITKVRPPTEDEVRLLRQDQTLISFFWPAQNS